MKLAGDEGKVDNIGDCGKRTYENLVDGAVPVMADVFFLMSVEKFA